MIDVAFLGTTVRPAGTAVVIDVLRATSTITLALASGYERVLVAGSIEEATALRTPERTLAGEVLVASLLNMAAVLAQLADREDILLVCAGTDGEVSMEDVYLAGRLSAKLDGERSDAARIAEAVAAAFPNAVDALDASAGAIGLRREGLESDIAFCAQESIVEVVGRLSQTVDGAALLTAAPTAATSESSEPAELHS